MNVIGDAGFNMYLRAEDTKPMSPTLTYDQMIAAIVEKNVRTSTAAAKKCFCGSFCQMAAAAAAATTTGSGAAGSASAGAVRVEDKAVTECLVSSLNISNGENILSLTPNYLCEGFTFGDASLKAFVAFLVTDAASAAAAGVGAGEKKRVACALREQLRLHPSCAAHMVPCYRALMLTASEEFASVSVLEYVTGRVEQLVSVHNDVRIADTRTSRRRRQQTRMFDDSPKKKVKMTSAAVTPYVDDVDDKTTSTWAAGSEDAADATSHLLAAFGCLVDVVRHDLGYVLKQQQRPQPHASILARLAFARGPTGDRWMLNAPFFVSICEIYKNCRSTPVLRRISLLLESVADLCALLECDDGVSGDDEGSNNGVDGSHGKSSGDGDVVGEDVIAASAAFDVAQLGPSCRALVKEFCVTVFGEKPAADRALVIATSLQPEWLRYHVTHYLIGKLFCQKVSFGVKGVVSIFNSIRKNVRRERVMDTSKVLKLVNHNQLTSAEVGEAESKKSTKNESDCTVAHLATKSLMKNVETISESDVADHVDKCIDFNVRQKLTPIVCKLLTVFTDSTIKIVKITGTRECVHTVSNFTKLRNILNELCGEKNIPTELNLVRRRLNKIIDL